MALLQLFLLACDANRGEAAGAREPDRGDAHAAGRHVERRLRRALPQRPRPAAPPPCQRDLRPGSGNERAVRHRLPSALQPRPRQAGETVLVHGASGGVGIAAVQLARARGLTVIGTAGTERGRKLVLSEGAHHVLDHTAPGYLDECVRLTGGQGPAIIMEMLANVNLQKDLGIIGMHGRIVVIGNRGAVEINARFAMNKNANILGMALTHASPFELAGIHVALVEGLRNGSLRPAIAQELPLSQAARSHEAVLEPGHHGKIILVP